MENQQRIFQNFHVFASNDWQKACDIALEHHIRKNEDWTEESKWYKIKFEMTKDGWKNKKIIMLERNELVELIEVLTWKKEQMLWQRNDPVKLFTFKNQGDSYYASLKQDSEVHWFKMSQYDAFRLLGLTTDALRNNINNELKIMITKEEVFAFISNLNPFKWAITQSKTTPAPKNSSEEEITLEDVEEAFGQAQPKHIPWKVDTTKRHECSECGEYLDPVKEAKVIDFSNKKYGRTVCFQCQKTI